MGLIVKPHTFHDNDPIIYSDMNDNFDTLYNAINGNLDNSNIALSANIDPIKIAGGATTLTTDQTIAAIKTFTKETVHAQISTPASNPASGYNKLYMKSDNSLYSLGSDGTERAVGGTPFAQDDEEAQTSENAGTWTQKCSVTITPRTTNVHLNFDGLGVGDPSGDLQLRIKRGATVLRTKPGDYSNAGHSVGLDWTDNGATPGASTTYTLEFRSGGAGHAVYLQYAVFNALAL